MVFIESRAFTQAGRKAEACKILNDLKDRSKRSYIPPYIFSALYLSLRDILQGLKWLEKACDERDAWLIWILSDPRLDIAHGESREILRRMCLPI